MVQGDHGAEVFGDPNCVTGGKVDFFIAGVQKGGTTALAGVLGRHPAIRMANVKEVHFFDDVRQDWGNPDYEPYHRWFRPSKPETLLSGEATPIYLYQSATLDRICHYNPAAKFIVCLRHPAFRAHSHWRMETLRGSETWEFRRAISPEGRTRVQDGDRASRIFSYVERGLYAGQIRHLFERFPRGQIHILRTDHLWSDPATSLADIYAFLRVTPTEQQGPAKYVVPHDSRTVGGLSVADRRELEDAFRKDIRETQAIAGLDLSDWLDPQYEEPMPSASGG